MSRPRLSVVIPAYNEQRRLPATLDGWREFLDGQPYEAEVLVADDGSTDGTAAVVDGASERDGRVRLVRLERNQGKGGAVREGVLAATGEVVLVVDADLNIPPAHVPAALALIAGGADVVVGTRSLREYAAGERSAVRLLAGAAVQVTRRVVTLPVIRDTQAGFKAYRAEMARLVFERTRVRSFAYDVEALFIARRLGAHIVQMPVTCEFRPESTYDVRKHLLPFLRDVVQVRRNSLRGLYG